MRNFFIDKKPLFLKLVTNKIPKLSLSQLLQKRYGINTTISNSITTLLGSHSALKLPKYHTNKNIKKFKNIYIKYYNSIDFILKKKHAKNLSARCNNNSYIGNRYLLKLPMYGQRRRSNGNTCKKIRPI